MTAKRSDFIHFSILVTALIMVIGVYFYFFSFLGSSYSPYYSDEFFYFKNSESFVVHTNLEAAFTYGGSGSRLFGVDAHGPGYPLLYGLISKVVGWNNLTIVVINFCVLLTAILALIFSEKKDKRIKIKQVLLVISSPITLFYSVTFMPELLHIAGGIFLFLLAKSYLRSLSKNDFAQLIGLILILGFFRNTWFFALIGLMILPGPLKGYQKLIFGGMGILLPFLFQYYLHEQVPNTFSGLSEMLTENRFTEAFDAVFFNIKRNIYFAFTYTEGWFYTLQKAWGGLTVIFALLFFRKIKLIQFGLIPLGVLVLFNIVLYKNYTWVDLRLYTPLVIFLNLGIIQNSKRLISSNSLLVLNLLSFVLILPLQLKLMEFRGDPDVKKITKEIADQLKQLPSGVVLVSSELLYDYKFDQLPIANKEQKPIYYILPYYEITSPQYDFELGISNGQLSACPKNSLCQ